MIFVVMLVLVAFSTLLWWRWRTRTDQRLQWLGTRERDWTTDELDALRSVDAAA